MAKIAKSKALVPQHPEKAKKKRALIRGTRRLLRPMKRGPAPWEPSPEERRQVEHFVACGMTQEQIGLVLDKSTDSLQRHCRHELDAGLLKVNARVGARLFKKAMDGDTASLIFWMKSRAGWKERHVFEHTGADGGAIITKDMNVEEAARLYREKLG